MSQKDISITTEAINAPSAAKSRQSVQFVYARIRQAILENEFTPYMEFSQVQLANQLNISRTPLREALRLLEREGLVESAVNRKVTVTGVSMADLEQLYAMRIQLETLGVYLTVLRLSEEELHKIARFLDTMLRFAEAQDYEAWQEPHRKFHQGLVQHAGERLVAAISHYSDHAERYRRIFIEEAARSWTTSIEDHQLIFEACTARNPAAAAERLAKHYSTIVLGVISQRDPGYDPAAVRTAWRMANTYTKSERKEGT